MKKFDIIFVKYLINDLIICEIFYDFLVFNIIVNLYSYIIIIMYKLGVLVMFMIYILYCN